jgi:hypothetical protein
VGAVGRQRNGVQEPAVTQTTAAILHSVLELQVQLGPGLFESACARVLGKDLSRSVRESNGRCRYTSPRRLNLLVGLL